MTPTSPLDAESAYEVMLRLAPSTRGPRVMAAQYSSTRCPNGRGVRTRQMLLRVRSIVNTRANAVLSNTARPAAPSLLALPANWLSEPSTWRAILSGTRLSISHFCSTS